MRRHDIKRIPIGVFPGCVAYRTTDICSIRQHNGGVRCGRWGERSGSLIFIGLVAVMVAVALLT